MADEYIALFKPLASKTGAGYPAIEDYFLSGISSGLARNILTSRVKLEKEEDLYAIAARLDLQWRRGQELHKSNPPRKSSNTGNSPRTTKLHKLTSEEQTKLIKEGRCFRCREQGHMSNECPLNSQGPSNRRQIKVATSNSTTTTPQEPESAISRIHALYSQFTPEEKEEVVNIDKAEGF